jgi:hypothetical protein
VNTTNQYFRRLQWQPVEHACGHFEARLMQDYGTRPLAGNPCSVCDAQGRTVVPSYGTQADALRACITHNAKAGRS